MFKFRWLHCLTLASMAFGANIANADVEVDPNLTVKKRPIVQGRPGISYDYLGVQYQSQDLDDWDCTQDGFEIYGSLDIQKGFFAVASLGDVSGDGCGSSRVAAGGGYRAAFNEQFDMFATVQFETISPDSGGSDSGLFIVGGLRGFLTDELEGVLALNHSTTFDGNTGISAGGRYWFSPQWAATLDIGLGSDVNTIQFGARYNF